MATVIFVEVLDRRGRVQRRQRFDRFPIAIGRAYSNDVILLDRQVSPEHLIVRESDGGLVIEDRDSLNGLFAKGSRRPVRSLALVSGTEVRIGHTRLRFCAPDQPMAPTIRRAGGGVAALVSRNPVRVAALVLAAGAILLDVFLESYSEAELTDVVGTLTLFVVCLFLWAGLWAIGTRLAVQEFHMIDHMTVAAVAVLALTVSEVATEYLGFLLSGGVFVGLLEWIAWAGVLAALIYAHLTVPGAMAPARRLRIALVTVAVASALVAVNWLDERDDFSPHPDYPSELKPVGAGWVPTRSPAEFFGGMRSLEQELEGEER